jgi:hypothetical protein
VYASGGVGALLASVSKGVSGNAASGAVGTAGVQHAQGLTGVSALGIADRVIVPLNSNFATGDVGSVTVGHGPTVSGVDATAAVGTVRVGDRVLALSGVSARGAAGNVIANYWKLVDDSQYVNWQNVDSAQANTWTLVDDNQVPNWELVEAST